MTHPFHPHSGQRLRVLFERQLASGRLLVCDDGESGTVTVSEAATDRAGAPADRPLTFELLVKLRAAVAAIKR
ncbi:MAG: hypothetical protein KY462_00010 [Actinobacteria bacterium]|nr:hypothetical protein [Actinomycetota bacterium]